MPRGRPKKVSSVPKLPIPDEFGREEYYCQYCGRSYSKQQGNFPVSKSPIYAGNNNYLCICKTCFEELYNHYVDVLGDEVAAIERMCMKFDLYFSMPIVESVLGTASGKSVIMTYVKRTALPAYKNKTYDSTIDDDDYQYMLSEQSRAPTEDEALEKRIIDEGKKNWGIELSVDDYRFLDAEFDEWNSRCNVDGKSRESLVRDLCMLKLQQNKALASGDIETYNKLNQTYQKTLQTANLTPKQMEEAERNSEIPLGELIKKIEDEEPIPEPLPEFRDVDRIHNFILVFFIGHLCSMLHIKNKYSDEYNATMEKYSANIPNNESIEDNEDIFEYLMQNGFSSIEATPSDEEEEV